MKKQSFFNGFLILLVGSVIAKGLGAVYRIPLTWILGVEGLGVYQLVFPIFSLVLVLSSTGMPAGISKMIALRKDNVAEVNKILKVSVISLFIIGLIFGLILFVCAGLISQIQGNTLATLPYMAIAPAVVLVSVLSAFRGYFQGRMNMVPTSMSNIFEQLFKLIFGLSLSFLFMPQGIEYGVLGAILGITLSEVVAVGYMFLIYVIEKKKEIKTVKDITNTLNNMPSVDVGIKSSKELLKELFKTAFPIVIATIILPFSLFVDSLLVVNLLNNSGWSVEQSTILWGIDTGIVTSIVNLPVVLTLSVATAVIPSLVSDIGQRQRRVREGMLISCNIAFPCALGVMFLAPQIVQFLYDGTLINGLINEELIASQLLSFSALLIIFTAILQTQNASLQGLGHSNIPIVNMFIAFVVKTLLILILVIQPTLNIFGVAIAKYSFFLIAVILNGIYLFKKTKFSLGITKEITVMAISSITMAFALFVFNNFNFGLTPYFMLPLEILLGVIVYIGSFMCLLPNKNYGKYLRFKKRKVTLE